MRKRAKKAVVPVMSQVNEKDSAFAMNAEFVHPSHTRVRIFDEDKVEIGMDEFAQRAFGDVDDFELPQVGDTLQQGDIAWKVNIGDRAVTQRMPVDGVVSEINSDPVTDKWILKVAATNLEENMANLIHAGAVTNWLKRARARFIADYAGQLGFAMQDGGELMHGFGRKLSDEQWKEFCKEFFNCADCEQKK